MNKVILLIMDSLGVGETKDSYLFGDTGANTLGSILSQNANLKINNLIKIGIGNIDTLKKYNIEVSNPCGYFSKMNELSNGKDTITGHWELVGIRTEVPFKTYPDGFPTEFVEEFQNRINKKVIGNYPASGTEIINSLGSEHEKTGSPIIYTSADSVLQIAANIDVIPLEELYMMCEIARELLVGEWACGRVIARPYKMLDNERIRTPDRKDYAVSPPEKTLLDFIKEKGLDVVSIGKIEDIFNGHGITKSIHTKSNMEGIDKTIECIKEDYNGLIFTNLVDFDSNFGHRRDPIGYGKALEEFDKRIPDIINAMNDNDILILTADHGNDPMYKGTDHTREFVPAIFVTKELWEGEIEGKDLGTRSSFADIGATIANIFETKKLKIGICIDEVTNLLK